MGQKVNPVGFRTGIMIGWKSRWYASKQEFGTPGEQVMSFDNNVLTLVFTLPLKTPAKARDRAARPFPIATSSCLSLISEIR